MTIYTNINSEALKKTVDPFRSIPKHALSTLIVDLKAIQHNYKKLCTAFAGEKVAAIVKDDAYSLGIQGVGSALEKAGCRDFFVSTVEEGLTLKRLLKQASNIYILNGLYEGAEELILKENFIPTLISYAQIKRWAEICTTQGEKRNAIIHFDTGMSRTGLPWNEFEVLRQNKTLMDSFTTQYLMSHLACSDEPNNPINQRQLKTLKDIKAAFPGHKTSFVNSDGIFMGNGFACDLARPGLALYGFNALADDLEPAVSVYGKILQVRTVEAGESIGYSATHTFDKPAKIATVPVGYAQGWSTGLSNRAHVAIKGTLCPIVGRVSMDLMGVDITDVPEEYVAENQWVELLGPTISPKNLAKAGRVIAYEIILTLRNHHRVYTELE